jgi:uncharacterized flavoprotein (TIGR03862 family)
MQSVAIIGAGPAGLIAAEHLAQAGHAVTVYDRMPSPGRKFLLAGRGGLNLTHDEPAERFIERYGPAGIWMAEALAVFPQTALRAWCEGLGQGTFVGSSGRVFPEAFKAAPLLRAWLQRLDRIGVRFAGRHRWHGWDTGGALIFETPDSTITVESAATLLALGGASWPRMGSDGTWVSVLRAAGLHVHDLRASNCGVRLPWSPIFAERFEGQPLKRIAVTAGDRTIRGEAVVTCDGLEGGAIYALSPELRSQLDRDGCATLHVDLRPDLALAALSARVDGARQGRSLSNFLRQSAQLSPVAIGLVQEALHAGEATDRLSTLVKAVPLRVSGLQPIARAISSAGGIARDELDAQLMLRRLPGLFAAGEMLDWEAPTGGYLLQGCFSTGVLAARGVTAWLAAQACGIGSGRS